MEALRPTDFLMIDKSRLALGIRQPWAELIVRGTKTVEVRKFSTNVRGRIYVYASKQVSDHPAGVAAAAEHELKIETLPRGVVVGSVELTESSLLTPGDSAAACLRAEDVTGRELFGWQLAAPERYGEPLSIRFLPYGIWFYPFRPRASQSS